MAPVTFDLRPDSLAPPTLPLSSLRGCAVAHEHFCFVVEDSGGDLVAFAKGTPHDGGVPGFAGELNKIYALQRVQRRGLGRLLLCSVARQFLSRGVTSMLLFGEATNPSNGFYEAFGAERLFSDTGEFNGAYGWRDLHTLVGKCRRRPIDEE